MLTPRFRRVWRRRLRRRPLLPFLLLATVAVDLVIWGTTKSDNPTPYASGFLGGQIALLGAWIGWSPRGISQRIAIAIGLAVLATAVVDDVSIPAEIEEASPEIAAAYRAINSAVILASLVATTLGAAAVRLAQRALRGRRLGAPWRARLGVATFLWVVTTLAAAYSFGRSANWQVLSYTMVIVLIAAEAVLTSLVLGLATLPMPRLLRSVLMVWTPLMVLLWLNDPEHAHFPMYYATLTATFGGWMLALEPPRRDNKPTTTSTPEVKEPAVVEEPLDVTA